MEESMSGNFKDIKVYKDILGKFEYIWIWNFELFLFLDLFMYATYFQSIQRIKGNITQERLVNICEKVAIILEEDTLGKKILVLLTHSWTFLINMKLSL